MLIIRLRSLSADNLRQHPSNGRARVCDSPIAYGGETKRFAAVTFEAKRCGVGRRGLDGERRDLRGREYGAGAGRSFRAASACESGWIRRWRWRLRPAAPPSSATSSQSPTFERATDVYRVSVKRCRKGSATVERSGRLPPEQQFYLKKKKTEPFSHVPLIGTAFSEPDQIGESSLSHIKKNIVEFENIWISWGG